MDMKDRFTGCMLGLALGDAMGAPFEGDPPGPKPLHMLPPILLYTDDTEMAIGVAESLAASGGLDPDHMAQRFAGNFNPARGYGRGTIEVIGLIRKGVHWGTANRRVFPEGSFGNGAAMRAAPVGLFFSGNADKLKEAAYGASAITHAHPLGKEGAHLTALAAALALKGVKSDQALDALINASTLEQYGGKLQAVKSLLAADHPAEEVVFRLGNTVLADESVPAAIYAFLRHGGDFMETVEFCLSLGGDTDTIAAMAGALSGAKVGAKGLPRALTARLENNRYISALAGELLSAAQKQGQGGQVPTW
jgi:poly(ADP-ribose) glycohydrolase ARH3